MEVRPVHGNDQCGLMNYSEDFSEKPLGVSAQETLGIYVELGPHPLIVLH